MMLIASQGGEVIPIAHVVEIYYVGTHHRQNVIIYPFGESFPIKVFCDYLSGFFNSKVSCYLEMVTLFRNLGF